MQILPQKLSLSENTLISRYGAVCDLGKEKKINIKINSAFIFNAVMIMICDVLGFFFAVEMGIFSVPLAQAVSRETCFSVT